MLNLNTPLRTIQALLALISLGLNGYGIYTQPVSHLYPTTTLPSSPARKIIDK